MQVFLKIGVLAFFSRSVTPEQFGIIGVATVVTDFSRMFSSMGVGPAVGLTGRIGLQQFSGFYFSQSVPPLHYKFLIMEEADVSIQQHSNMSFVHYARIKDAIEYIRHNFDRQPDLAEIADKVHLSPYHFQRLFTEWAGVSPKKFLQYVSIGYAKDLLRTKDRTLADVAWETGLSGTGRLHDMFVSIEGMSPGEFRNEGRDLLINYSFSETPFGEVLVASTGKGICYMAFVENQEEAYMKLQSMFPKARFSIQIDQNQQSALSIFSNDWTKPEKIRLHLKGSEFQLKVWEALLKIPFGGLSTYGAVASSVHSPDAARAVGTAVGANPVAYVIPCHRVIQAGGALGGYMWGPTRKAAMIGWEAARSIPHGT